ncbi:MAG: hypothetical protein P8Z30_15950 [Acidobacteriota bacterium]
MRKYGIWLTILLLFLGWTSLPGESQEAKQASGKDVNVTVTALRRGSNAPAELNAEDIFVYQNNVRRPVVRWIQATGQNSRLDLAILIDESLDTSIGSHFAELKDFIRSLPENTKVAIAYASYGNAQMAQDFTFDHERAAAAIHLPRGPLTEASSTYRALTSLVKRWPEDGGRRAVLVLSDGINLYWGVSQALPTNNPDLQQAIAAAQRHGVNVYSIYAETAGNLRQDSFLVTIGQSCLQELAQATGGKAYFEGSRTPVNFQTIFQNLKDRFANQYRLTFRAQEGEKEAYDRLRLSTEQPGVELIASRRVYVPAIAR